MGITLTAPMQAKLSLDISSSPNQPQRFTIVGLWGRYILKPQTEQFKYMPEVEDLTMHLAELAKVNVVPHSLIRFADGELAYILHWQLFTLCGSIYTFQYDTAYIKSSDAESISLTLPISEKPYTSLILFPFFDGLIPEGWLLDIAEKSWKINRRDRMSLLLACCKDCIGAVSVIPILNKE